MSPLWLLLALAAFTASWRWRAAGRIGRVALAATGVVLALIATRVIALPSVDEIVTEVGGRLGDWTYLLVGINAFLETGAFLGFVAPGETMVLFGGVLAGAGTISLEPLIVVVWASAFLGDMAAYAIGRRYGRDFLLRHGARVKIGEAQIAFVEQFFERRGSMTVLLGRWVGVVRPLVPFLAGSSKLPALRFAIVDFISAGLWASVLCVLGSVFWQNFDELTSVVGQALFVLAAVIVVVVAVGLSVATRRSRRRSATVERWIAEQLDDRAWLGRPAAALWAMVGRIEPHLPGRRSRRPAADEPGSVSESPTGEPAGVHHSDDDPR